MTRSRLMAASTCSNAAGCLADRLVGMAVPCVRLESYEGDLVDLAGMSPVVVYVYPGGGGSPGDGVQVSPVDSLLHRAFRDHQLELQERGYQVVGVSSQSVCLQGESALVDDISHTLLSDPELQLAEELGLATFELHGARCYRRLTLVVAGGRIEKAFYPPASSTRSAAQVLAWMALNSVSPMTLGEPTHPPGTAGTSSPGVLRAVTRPVVVPAAVVPLLRGGVLAELGSAVDILTEQLARDGIEPSAFVAALDWVDGARAVLDVIGTSDRDAEADVTLELGDATRVVLEALRVVRRTETQRLQDAAVDGFEIPLRALPALTNLIATIQRTTELPARREREACRTSVKRSPGADRPLGRHLSPV